MQHICNTEQETTKIAHQIGEKLSQGGLLLLNGELGTGKTFFTQALLKNLGFADNTAKSPTYTYIRHYQKGPQNVYHLDLYRLTASDPLLEEEIEEILSPPKNTIIVEWATKMPLLKAHKHISIEFEYIDPTTRKLTIDENL